MSDKTLAKIKEILEGCNAWSNDAAWQIPKSNNWAIKHKALEVVAAAKGIIFDAPDILESNALESVSMIVTGRMDDRVEWSVGECSTQNYKAFSVEKMAAYPWAMAEKRAKDRVILKLVGLHGYAYSEDEADDFKVPQNAPSADPFDDDPQEMIVRHYQDALINIDKAAAPNNLAAVKASFVTPYWDQFSKEQQDAITKAGKAKAAQFEQEKAA